MSLKNDENIVKFVKEMEGKKIRVQMLSGKKKEQSAFYLPLINKLVNE